MTDEEVRAAVERAAYEVSRIAADLDDVFTHAPMRTNLLGFRDDLRVLRDRMLRVRVEMTPE